MWRRSGFVMASGHLEKPSCWRRCRFEPHADLRLRHGKRVAPGVRLGIRRIPIGSPQNPAHSSNRHRRQHLIGAHRDKYGGGQKQRPPIGYSMRPASFLHVHPASKNRMPINNHGRPRTGRMEASPPQQPLHADIRHHNQPLGPMLGRTGNGCVHQCNRRF